MKNITCPNCGAPCVESGIGISHEQTPLEKAASELLDALKHMKEFIDVCASQNYENQHVYKQIQNNTFYKEIDLAIKKAQ